MLCGHHWVTTSHQVADRRSSSGRLRHLGRLDSKFKMTATFTPPEKGLITIYVKAAKVSSTFYMDPKPVIS